MLVAKGAPVRCVRPFSIAHPLHLKPACPGLAGAAGPNLQATGRRNGSCVVRVKVLEAKMGVGGIFSTMQGSGGKSLWVEPPALWVGTCSVDGYLQTLVWWKGGLLGACGGFWVH